MIWVLYLKYEDYKQVFYTAIVGCVYYVAVGSDGIGLDDAGYVYDEIPDKLWR